VTRAALRGILLALLAALVAGFVAGTVIRMRLERPIRYLGVLVPVARGPLDVAAAGPAVLHPGHHEQQVG
jgi:hypothetical protein